MQTISLPTSITKIKLEEQDLLASLAWRFHNDNNSLWEQLMNARNIDTNSPHTPAHTWNNVCAG